MSIYEKVTLTEKAHDVVLIGEVLVDKIYDKKKKTYETIMGGSTSNIAMNLKHLGRKLKYFGSVGNDDYGKQILEKLEVNGLETKSIHVSEFPTSIVEINKSEGTPAPKFYRSSDNQIHFTKELKESLIDTKILHFSYWPLSVEPSRSTLLQAIDLAKRNNVIIGFDPNYHRDLDETGGLGIREILKIAKKVDIIKPSLDDSIRIFGEGLSPKEYIQKYVELGCSLVVMTLGEQGLIASCKGEIIEMKSLAKIVVDTTGAGDAFWGGFYSGILTSETIEDSLRIGLLCSAYNLKEVGAFNNFPSLKEMKKELKIGV